MDQARAHYDAGLTIHREVGNRRSEGNVLANLGFLHQEQGRMDEASELVDAALAVAREVGDPRVEGIVLGNLGTLLLQQGRLDEARAHLANGECLLREFSDPVELAKLLCTRARLEAQAGDPAAAHAAMTEATDLAARLAAGPDSTLGKALAKARAALETP